MAARYDRVRLPVGDSVVRASVAQTAFDGTCRAFNYNLQEHSIHLQTCNKKTHLVKCKYISTEYEGVIILLSEPPPTLIGV